MAECVTEQRRMRSIARTWTHLYVAPEQLLARKGTGKETPSKTVLAG